MMNRKKNKGDLLTITQASMVLGVTRQALWAATVAGRIKTLKFAHLKLIPRAELEKYKRTRHAGGRPVKKKRHK